MSCTNVVRTSKGQQWLIALSGDLSSESAQEALAEVRATMPSASEVSDEELANWVTEEIMKLPIKCPDCEKSEVS